MTRKISSTGVGGLISALLLLLSAPAFAERCEEAFRGAGAQMPVAAEASAAAAPRAPNIFRLRAVSARALPPTLRQIFGNAERRSGRGTLGGGSVGRDEPAGLERALKAQPIQAMYVDPSARPALNVDRFLRIADPDGRIKFETLPSGRRRYRFESTIGFVVAFTIDIAPHVLEYMAEVVDRTRAPSRWHQDRPSLIAGGLSKTAPVVKIETGELQITDGEVQSWMTAAVLHAKLIGANVLTTQIAADVLLRQGLRKDSVSIWGWTTVTQVREPWISLESSSAKAFARMQTKQDVAQAKLGEQGLRRKYFDVLEQLYMRAKFPEAETYTSTRIGADWDALRTIDDDMLKMYQASHHGFHAKQFMADPRFAKHAEDWRAGLEVAPDRELLFRIAHFEYVRSAAVLTFAYGTAAPSATDQQMIAAFASAMQALGYSADSARNAVYN